jgi:hypothetical protein
MQAKYRKINPAGDLGPEPGTAGASRGGNAFPAVLSGKRLTPFVLPPDFDTSVHQQARASGNVKATSLADLAEMIAALERKSKGSPGNSLWIGMDGSQ